jgi:drug/metabolite transporter (DMT)-like permease
VKHASPSGASLGYALVGGAAASWGLWPLVLREAARFGEVDASLWSAALMAVMTVATLPSLVGCSLQATPRRVLGYVALLGVTDAANAWLFFQAYRTTTVALAVTTHYLAPILVALFAPVVNGEARHPRASVAAVAAFAGLLLVLNPFATTLDRTAIVGSCFGAASAVAYAANVFLNRRIGEAFTGPQVMALHGFVATPLLVALTPVAAWSTTAPGTYGVLTLAGVTIGAASGVAFIRGLRLIPTAHSAVLTFLEPIVALALGVLVLGQPLEPRAILGACAILGAGAFVIAPSRGEGA